MTDNLQRVADAERAQQAWHEFVKPIVDVVRGDYMVKLAEYAERPMSGDNLKVVEKMSLAIRVTREVEKQMLAMITDGDAAKVDIDRAGKIARMSAEERRYATY